MFQNLKSKKHLILSCIIGFLVILFAILTFYEYKIYLKYKTNSRAVINYAYVNFILIIVFISHLVYFLYSLVIKNSGQKQSRFQLKLITIFCLMTIIPTFVLTIGSLLFFNEGLHKWFDEKIVTILNKSNDIANSYILENEKSLENIAFSIASDIDKIYFSYKSNPKAFKNYLNIESSKRSVQELLIFQPKTNKIISSSNFAMSLSFVNIPITAIKECTNKKAIIISSGPKKMRVMIKLLKGHNALLEEDTYLIAGKFIDQTMTQYANQVEKIAKEYSYIKENIVASHIKFIGAFVAFSIVLLIIVMIIGFLIANNILQPIKELVLGVDKISKGDFSFRVKEPQKSKDEISTLAKAFNYMTQMLHEQREDLKIAQQTKAWGDVAKRVAHEIKNPLTPIQLAADRLLQKFTDKVEDKEQFSKYVNAIINHSSDIKKIITDFVNFARLPEPVLEKANFSDTIKNVIETRSALFDQFQYNLFIENNIIRKVDVGQIRQVLVNLLKNAEHSTSLRRMQEIESNYHPTPCVINISLYYNKEKKLILRCEDNGTGFDKYILDGQKEDNKISRSNGMGIGLSIVNRIIVAHKGHMEFSNLPPNGARVEVVFD
jgi:two-component system nitrogen regulation sensor histidine kinase NtrY